MKQSIKTRKIGTLTLILIMIIICTIFTTVSNKTLSDYNIDNGFIQPNSDIRWLPIYSNHEDIQSSTTKEQKNVINKIESIKKEVQFNQHNIPKNNINVESKTLENTRQNLKRHKVDLEFQRIIDISPLVLFFESSNKNSLKIKNIILNEYEVYPEITIVDFDKYFNKDELKSYVQESIHLNPTGISNSTYLFLKRTPIIYHELEDKFLELHSKNFFAEKIKKICKGSILFNKIYLPSNN